jgi:hypothetical protein
LDVVFPIGPAYIAPKRLGPQGNPTAPPIDRAAKPPHDVEAPSWATGTPGAPGRCSCMNGTPDTPVLSGGEAPEDALSTCPLAIIPLFIAGGDVAPRALARASGATVTAACGDCCWLAAADSFSSPEIAADGSSQSPPCLSLGEGSVWVRPAIPSRSQRLNSRDQGSTFSAPAHQKRGLVPGPCVVRVMW